MDSAVHRFPGFWRCWRRFTGRHFHPGLPDHLRWPDQFHFSVLLHPFSQGQIPQVGEHHRGILFPYLQPGSECHFEHIHPHSERHLPCSHRADPAGPIPQILAEQLLRVSYDHRRHSRGQCDLRSGCRGTKAAPTWRSVPQAAPL